MSYLCPHAATPEFPHRGSIKAYLILYKASMKPVFAMHTAVHANGNRGNKTGWAGLPSHQPKSSDYECAGLSVDLLDGSPRQR